MNNILPADESLPGRAFRLLGRLLKLVQAIKDAADDLRTNSGILLSLGGKLAWAIPLVVVPHLFLTFPLFYAGFRNVGPEWAWALAAVALIGLDALALVRRSYVFHMAALLLGMFVWFFLSSLATHGTPRGWMGMPGAPSAYIYAFAAAACLIGMIRMTQRENASAQADSFLMQARLAQMELGTENEQYEAARSAHRLKGKIAERK